MCMRIGFSGCAGGGVASGSIAMLVAIGRRGASGARAETGELGSGGRSEGPPQLEQTRANKNADEAKGARVRFISK
jgi:hypothetical protein